MHPICATSGPVARAKPAPVKIIVDVRERESGIAEPLAELDAEAEFASLRQATTPSAPTRCSSASASTTFAERS